MTKFKEFFKKNVNNNKEKHIVVLSDLYLKFLQEVPVTNKKHSTRRFMIALKKHLRSKHRIFEIKEQIFGNNLNKVMVIHPKSKPSSKDISQFIFFNLLTIASLVMLSKIENRKKDLNKPATEEEKPTEE